MVKLTKADFKCKCGCNTNLIKQDLIDLCNTIAEKVDLTLTVNSGYRCATHNTSVGGATNSQHKQGKAADLSCSNLSKLKEECKKLWDDSTIGGMGKYNTFVHVDTGTHRQWTGS